MAHNFRPIGVFFVVLSILCLIDKLTTIEFLSVQCLSLLEKELVTLGAMCGGALLTEDLSLLFAGNTHSLVLV